ncbi:MAG: biotin--[acetyl-CoA-carboxylase] ligase [Candidatus Binatia bacterium]|nr:biotin--[acetyl-CoA-carboxylase] ligase [Candidatus Binatia bacterium]
MTTVVATPLDIVRLEALLQGARLGLPLHYRAVTESTNDDAATLAREGAPEGTTVVADAQTRGRGRRGRSWSSPPNLNAYVSVVLRPAIPPERAPQLGIVAGLAALQAIRALLPEAELKWPNDVLVRGRKLCGVLAEMSAASETALDFVIVGIGVNINALVADFPEELRGLATSLRIECGRTIDREEFIAGLLAGLGAEYERFTAEGFAPIRQRWEQVCGTIGKRVEVDTGSTRFAGTVLGLDEGGALRVERMDGGEVEIISGDVYLRESASSVR